MFNPFRENCLLYTIDGEYTRVPVYWFAGIPYVYYYKDYIRLSYDGSTSKSYYRWNLLKNKSRLAIWLNDYYFKVTEMDTKNA